MPQRAVWRASYTFPSVLTSAYLPPHSRKHGATPSYGADDGKRRPAVRPPPYVPRAAYRNSRGWRWWHRDWLSVAASASPRPVRWRWRRWSVRSTSRDSCGHSIPHSVSYHASRREGRCRAYSRIPSKPYSHATCSWRPPRCDTWHDCLSYNRVPNRSRRCRMWIWPPQGILEKNGSGILREVRGNRIRGGREMPSTA